MTDPLEALKWHDNSAKTRYEPTDLMMMDFISEYVIGHSVKPASREFARVVSVVTEEGTYKGKTFRQAVMNAMTAWDEINDH